MLEPKLPVEGLLGTWGRVLPHSHAQHQLGVGLGSVVSMWIWWWILGGSSGGLQPGLLPVAGRLSGTYYGCHVRASGARKGQWGGGGGAGVELASAFLLQSTAGLLCQRQLCLFLLFYLVSWLLQTGKGLGQGCQHCRVHMGQALDCMFPSRCCVVGDLGHRTQSKNKTRTKDIGVWMIDWFLCVVSPVASALAAALSGSQ